jgi:hypothetical protein
MTVSVQALSLLQRNWAIEAFGNERLTAAHEDANTLFVQQTLGTALTCANEKPADTGRLTKIEQALNVYEVIAAAGLSGLRRNQKDADTAAAGAAAFRAYELRRALPLPTSLQEFSFHVLHLGSLAYCSDRWAEFRGLLQSRAIPVSAPDGSGEWDQTLLQSITTIWLHIFRKDGWEDLDKVAERVAALRAAQPAAEERFFASQTAQESGSAAWRLISLYHLAKATEHLAEFMLQGTPADIRTELGFHFDRAVDAASTALDVRLEILLRWLHAASHRMSLGSLWATASTSDSAKQLVSAATSRSMFEMLPPQRMAIQEEGLLDPASGAVVVDLPTSSGKTILAEFKIVQALEQFRSDGGWVAYVAPTRALVAQITRRLRSDFAGMGIQVEQLSAALEVDQLESDGEFQGSTHASGQNGRVTRARRPLEPTACHAIRSQRMNATSSMNACQ